MKTAKIGNDIIITKNYSFIGLKMKIAKIEDNGVIWANFYKKTIPSYLKSEVNSTWVFFPDEYKLVETKKEPRRFSTWKFMAWELSNGGRANADHMSDAITGIADHNKSIQDIGGYNSWQFRCDGLTVAEMNDLGYGCAPSWTISSRQYRRYKADNK